MKNTNLYSTQDFPLTVVLMYFGYRLESIQFSESDKRAYFIFIPTEKIQSLINDFWNEKLVIEPQKFLNEYKLLKNRLNEVKRQYENK